MLDFAQCERLVSQARDKRSKPIDNNTRVERRNEDTYALRLHKTDIATFHRDGRITVNSGGYRTVTTKDRLWGYVTRHLFSERGIWYLWAEPSPDDPEPARGERSVLKPFQAFDPGPEPVKPTEGCVAGEIHAVPFQTDELVSTYDISSGKVSEDDIVRPYEHGDPFVGYRTVDAITYTYFGEANYSHNTEYKTLIGRVYDIDPDDKIEYEQCPHCALFEKQHRAWSEAMRGGGWGRNRTHGYQAMVENLERYGSQEAWQEAYIADFRKARADRSAHKAWVERNRVLFEDGMEITAQGYAPRPDTKKIAQVTRRERKVAKQRERINKFVDDAVNELATKGVPMPSGGDCWGCCFRAEGDPSIEPLGVDHLAQHIRERYYVPSMFVNALREAGYRDAGIYMFLAMDPENNRMGGPREPFRQVDGHTVRRALRRYLYKRLIPEYGSSSIPPMVGNVSRG